MAQTVAQIVAQSISRSQGIDSHLPDSGAAINAAVHIPPATIHGTILSGLSFPAMSFPPSAVSLQCKCDDNAARAACVTI